MNDHGDKQFQGLNNNNFNVDNGLENHYQGFNNNNVNVNNGLESHYQGLNNNVNVNNGLENHYQGFNNNVNVNNGVNNHNQGFNNNANVNNGVGNHYQGFNNNANVNNGLENCYQGLNYNVNVNNGLENYYQELNNDVNVSNSLENHYQQYQDVNNNVNVNNGVENYYQGFNNNVNVNYGVENHYQGFNNNANINNGFENHYQGLNNNVNFNNGLENYYQELNNNVNVSNSLENHYQQYQDVNNNVNVNNGVENHYVQQFQGLNNNNVNINNGGNVEVEYLDSFPKGYRFFPDDYELTVHYLMKKVNNEELPPNRIHEVELYKFGPKALTEKHRPNDGNVWLFFTPRDRKYTNGSRPNRVVAGDGYWRATGKDRHIKNISGDVVGFKKALVYFAGNPPKGVKTNWIMHEYRVNNPPTLVIGPNNHMQLDWVLCRIYHRDGKRNDEGDDQSSSPAAPIPSPLSVEGNTPSTSLLHSQENVQIMSSADQIDQNDDVFVHSIDPLSTSLDPNSWQYREMYKISNTNVQVNSSTTVFNNCANVQVNSSSQDCQSGYLSNTHPDNNLVYVDDDKLQNLLDAWVPHEPVPTEANIQQSSPVGGVIAQQSAFAENVAHFTGVAAQQSVPGTDDVSKQSAIKTEVAPFADTKTIEIMAYLNFDSDFQDIP